MMFHSHFSILLFKVGSASLMSCIIANGGGQL